MATIEIMRLPAVMAATGLRKSAIYHAAQRGAFPKPFKLLGRASGWRSDEIQAWLESRERFDAA